MSRRASARLRNKTLSSDDCILTSSEDDGDVVCYICSGGDFTHYNQIILCDGDRCQKGVHQRCHSPILKTVPDGAWYCIPCTDKQTRPDPVVVGENTCPVTTLIQCVNHQFCRVCLVVSPECRDSALQDGIWRCQECSDEHNELDAWFWSDIDNLIKNGQGP